MLIVVLRGLSFVCWEREMAHISSRFLDYTYKYKNNSVAKQLSRLRRLSQSQEGSEATGLPALWNSNCIWLMALQAASLGFYVRTVFSNVVQSRTSLSTIWPWNALWDSAKRISLTTWGQSNKSKPLSDFALINEVCSWMGPKIPNHPGAP